MAERCIEKLISERAECWRKQRRGEMKAGGGGGFREEPSGNRGWVTISEARYS